MEVQLVVGGGRVAGTLLVSLAGSYFGSRLARRTSWRERVSDALPRFFTRRPSSPGTPGSVPRPPRRPQRGALPRAVPLRLHPAVYGRPRWRHTESARHL